MQSDIFLQIFYQIAFILWLKIPLEVFRTLWREILFFVALHN